MKLAIFTLVEHKLINGSYYGYAPYIREMNIWVKPFDEVIVVAPLSKSNRVSQIDLAYVHPNVKLIQIPSFNTKSVFQCMRLLWVAPNIWIKSALAIKASNYLHFRCPSNVAALALMVQMLFPKKPKSTKYAGNWDPNSKQPLGYRLQQAILRRKFLSSNMEVLVYGEWPNEPNHIKAFISATYREREKIKFTPKIYDETLHFVFAGALVIGKRPLLTIQIIEKLHQRSLPVKLHLYGDGPLLDALRQYVKEKNLNAVVNLYGNQSKEVIKQQLLNSHFGILPSKSEGWPKAVAECMFFGCIPIATPVSCVPWMLGQGERGILIPPDLDEAVNYVYQVIDKKEKLNTMAEAALNWSQRFTFDRLEIEIQEVLHAGIKMD